jgi:hypothetical protein
MYIGGNGDHTLSPGGACQGVSNKGAPERSDGAGVDASRGLPGPA